MFGAFSENQYLSTLIEDAFNLSGNRFGSTNILRQVPEHILNTGLWRKINARVEPM